MYQQWGDWGTPPGWGRSWGTPPGWGHPYGCACGCGTCDSAGWGALLQRRDDYGIIGLLAAGAAWLGLRGRVQPRAECARLKAKLTEAHRTGAKRSKIARLEKKVRKACARAAAADQRRSARLQRKAERKGLKTGGRAGRARGGRRGGTAAEPYAVDAGLEADMMPLDEGTYDLAAETGGGFDFSTLLPWLGLLGVGILGFALVKGSKGSKGSKSSGAVAA